MTQQFKAHRRQCLAEFSDYLTQKVDREMFERYCKIQAESLLRRHNGGFTWVDLHGSQIAVESLVGVNTGTTFTVTLPCSANSM